MERIKTDRKTQVLIGVSALGILIALYMALVIAPTEATMGDVQRIFYWHVATAWVGFLAFFVTFIASIVYLRTGRRQWDIIALSSVEVGMAYSVIMTITGTIWAKPIWNTWWTWEPRLTSVTIMLLIYASYLLLRRMIDEPARQARFAAVYGIAGFISVPITFMAVRWWRTIHPVIVESSGFNLSSTMVLALIVSVVAFSLFYVTLLTLRSRIETASDAVAELKMRLEDR